MKVKDLIKDLKKFHPETLVVLPSDAEGNSFSPAASASHQYYVAESSWSGEIIDDDDVTNYDEVDSVVVIWPTN